MDTQSQDIGYLDQSIVTQDDVQDLPTNELLNAQLIDYKCQRYALWDIHRFIEQVLATDKPGFLISTDKHGKATIRERPLAWHFKLIRSYIQRIPLDAKPSPLIALFQECCVEMGLFDGLTRAGDFTGPASNEAERYNAFLELIRAKALTLARYIKAKEDISNYDLRMFARLRKYIDSLFLVYSKLLVVRLDLEYGDGFAEYMTLAQAKKDISRFISNRRWCKHFEHCVGFIIAREHGKNGCGFHFHCILFFNGQKRQQDINLAKAIGKDYWEGNITRISGEGDTLITRGRHFNCNAKQDKYRYQGIGMIAHSDEAKRSNLLYALIYLAKVDQGLEGIAPPKTKTITRGLLPEVAETRSGAPRKMGVRGNRLTVSRNDSLAHLANYRDKRNLGMDQQQPEMRGPFCG